MATDGSFKLPRFAGSVAHTLATFLATHNKTLLPGAVNAVMHQGAPHFVAIDTKKSDLPTRGRQLGGYIACRQHRQRAVHAGHSSCTHRSGPPADRLLARAQHNLRKCLQRAFVRDKKKRA